VAAAAELARAAAEAEAAALAAAKEEAEAREAKAAGSAVNVSSLSPLPAAVAVPLSAAKSFQVKFLAFAGLLRPILLQVGLDWQYLHPYLSTSLIDIHKLRTRLFSLSSPPHAPRKRIQYTVSAPF
jgi:hypothetical protein